MRLTIALLAISFVTVSCRQHSGSAIASDDTSVDGINFASVAKVKDECLHRIINEEDRNELENYDRLAAKLKKQVDNASDRALFIAKQQFNRSDLTVKSKVIRVSAPRGTSDRFVERVHVAVGAQNSNDDLDFHFYNGNVYADPTTLKMDLLTIRRSGLNQQGAMSYIVCENN